MINYCGPWVRELVESVDPDAPDLFLPSLAFSVLLDHEPALSGAVAVTPKRRGASTYLSYPWRSKLLAATYHAPWGGDTEPRGPREEEIALVIGALQEALPSLPLTTDDVRSVHWGLLRVVAPGPAKLSDLLRNRQRQLRDLIRGLTTREPLVRASNLLLRRTDWGVWFDAGEAPVTPVRTMVEEALAGRSGRDSAGEGFRPPLRGKLEGSGSHPS